MRLIHLVKKQKTGVPGVGGLRLNPDRHFLLHTDGRLAILLFSHP
jgi:hypothetical protein